MHNDKKMFAPSVRGVGSRQRTPVERQVQLQLVALGHWISRKYFGEFNFMAMEV